MSKPEVEDIYPEDVRLALDNGRDFANGFVEKDWKKIVDEELKEVKNKLLKIGEKEEDIKTRLGKIIEEHKEEIIDKLIQELTAARGATKTSNQGGSTN